jgi:hypothetical protein
VAIVVIYGTFFITFLGQTGPRDADQFLVFHSLQYWNATMFGLAKQWTPLICAGLSVAGEPHRQLGIRIDYDEVERLSFRRLDDPSINISRGFGRN